MNQKTIIRDLTTGNPIKQLLVFALPIMMGTLLQQLYATVDTIILGRFVGKTASWNAVDGGGEP